MRVLEDTLERALDKLPDLMFSQLLREKLAEQGVQASDRAIQHIREQIMDSDAAPVRFWNWAWKFWERRDLEIKFTEADVLEIESRLNIEEILQQTVSDCAEGILADLRQKWRNERRREAKELKGFRRRLDGEWGNALDALTFQITVCREFGMGVNSEARAERVADQGAARIEVLLRLHARACQVADEIVCLLYAGFADGAMSRWRTMYEIAVIAIFIHDHDEDLAQRYLDYAAVENARAVRGYKECEERLGFDPISDAELAEVEAAKDQMLAKHGAGFGCRLGWASKQLGKKKPEFKDIEKAVSFEHLRAHYRLASYSIHAEVHGILFRLGVPNGVDVLLSGPSNHGLQEPGQNTAISLAQISITLLNLHPILDNVVGMRVISDLSDQAVREFTSHPSAP